MFSYQVRKKLRMVLPLPASEWLNEATRPKSIRAASQKVSSNANLPQLGKAIRPKLIVLSWIIGLIIACLILAPVNVDGAGPESVPAPAATPAG